ncbi:MAG: lasso peptide biosynthesis B2 protein [Silvibacterium sp.]
MKLLVFESWLLLLYFEAVMRFRSFAVLHQTVRKQPVHPVCLTDTTPTPEDLCHAVDLACAFYFKRVMCLQRSAATILLMRRRGLRAEMVIGAQLLPFKSHAWVEIEGRIVNDKPYMRDIYQV